MPLTVDAMSHLTIYESCVRASVPAIAVARVDIWFWAFRDALSCLAHARVGLNWVTCGFVGLQPRLAPGGVDKEDFLAMGWSDEAPARLQEVFKEMDESKCSVAGCGFASDQGVFNRAVRRLSSFGVIRSWQSTPDG